MCLLIALHAEGSLVVAANRDEWLARPSTAMTILRAKGPRILGGRDELAGGTWLAVNEHGLVAGLTNRPRTQGYDPSKRSRGELPLLLAAHRTAAEAVAAFARDVRTGDYNPCWLLVGDRETLWYLDATGERAAVQQLPAGLHVLENAPLGVATAKTERIRALVGNIDLTDVLRSHEGDGLTAACVHAGPAYGTRSSEIITVDAGRPRIRVADGPPCTTDFRDATPAWDE